MKNTFFLCLVAICLSSCNSKLVTKTAAIEEDIQVPKAEHVFYTGTYTHESSEGIYKYSISSDGELKSLGLVAITEEPSFITLSKDGKYLLAVNETHTKGKGGTIESYRITDSSLEKINSAYTGGAHPCHVTINERNDVLCANYTGGSVGLFTLLEGGELSERKALIQHEGKGTHKRQEGPRAHSAWFVSGGSDVIALDLGTNELVFTNIAEMSFQKTKADNLQMAAEAGPRHLCFHPSGKWIYVLNELNNTLTQVLKSENGYNKIIENVSNLPEDFKEFSKGADIHISSDGNFVYASNRGHNSIAIFSVHTTTGNLSLIGFESTRGKCPRSFSLSPDDKYLVVANEKSNSLVSFRRDLEKGTLTFVSEILAPTPVSIAFE